MSDTILIHHQEAAPTSIDERALEQFSGKVMADVGSALAVLLSFIGDQTGVYRAMRDLGPSGFEEIAEAAGVDARYLLEWLSANAAAGYVDYDPEQETFRLSPEQAIVLAQEGHPACFQGFMQQVTAQFTTHEKAIDTFRSGKGRGWEDHHACCFCGTDRFFRPGYAANLIGAWLPALEGVVEKLQSGATVADVGCGHGSSTILMAEAFPKSTFHGFDFHRPSVQEARNGAASVGLANVSFETAAAKSYPGNSYDLVCMFDALHDMGDPVGAARHIRETLAPDGTLMLVEPLAGDSLADNLNLVSQLFYAASTLICTPASRAQEVGLALGAQAGEKRIVEVLREAGFTRIRRAAETPVNMIIEARP
ncbi:class I SAM-dependent methyltransferase [Sphingosinicella rhizophila]|uniref:Class I SAM-dependent methyltransferase n=1 Tax=Sphingosinicella rhizophila TaxID=3050082 RepID=A0ABU3QB45_9SPHN|nr:class I SAM-dependent methyltransferase [Sphingosinicella sp. GR2756]MDT9600175.1 class I SAM-dependent methyltransferase [Sphingosinicella sp. GR2756]